MALMALGVGSAAPAQANGGTDGPACPSFNQAGQGVANRLAQLRTDYAGLTNSINALNSTAQTLQKRLSDLAVASGDKVVVKGSEADAKVSTFGPANLSGSLVVGVSNVLISSAKDIATTYLLDEAEAKLCNASIRRFPNTCAFRASMDGAAVTIQTAALGFRRDLYAYPACHAALPFGDPLPASLDPANAADPRWDYYVVTALVARAYALETSNTLNSAPGQAPGAAGTMTKDDLKQIIVMIAAHPYIDRIKAAIIDVTADLQALAPNAPPRTPDQLRDVLAKATADLDRIRATNDVVEVKALDARLKGLDLSTNFSTDTVVNALLDALKDSDKDRTAKIAAILDALVAASKGEYDTAALDSLAALGCGATPTGEAAANQKLCSTLVLVGQVAAAKDQTQMDAALQAVLSPTAPYARQAKDPMWSVAALVGVAGGLEQVHGSAGHTSVAAGGLFLPIGAECTLPFPNGKGHYGLLVSVVDLGAIATASQSKTGSSGDTVQSAPNVKFSSIISPGLYFSAGLRSPLSFGLGISYGPGLRRTTNDGVTTDANAVRYLAFIAIEMSLFGH